MLWYDTAINRHKPVYLRMYHLVPLVGILANSAFQRNAQDILNQNNSKQPITLYILSIPLKSRIHQDPDQWYKVVHMEINRFMTVYSGIIP
jgi:hypothetical protein